MSTKALRKELLAAIAMVIVAAIALSGSTYAWFANNNTVTANNIQVQAQVEGGIEIVRGKAADANKDHKTTDASTLDEAILYPTSTLDTSAWYHASAALANASTALANTYETLSITETTAKAGIGYNDVDSDSAYNVATDHAFYLVDTFNIRSVSENLAKGLSVKEVKATYTSNAAMNAALRVAVKCGSIVKIYAPFNNSAAAYAVYSGYTGTGADGDPYVATKAGDVTITDKGALTLIQASADTEIPAKGASTNGGVDVEIYAWFEGEDASLYTDNFDANTLTIEVSFQ